MVAKRSVTKKAKAEEVTEEEEVFIDDEEFPEEDNYFLSDKKDIDFISSGCALLNAVLGGGWAHGRMGNVVGDKSSGKTLLAIEACANFAMQYKADESRIWYNEAESAFDESYAAALGMPIDRINFVCGKEPKEVFVDDGNHTVEGLFDHLTKVIEYHEKHKIKHGLYIVDSLDAFSDRAELERDIDAGSYGANKPKKMGELFRRLVRRIEKAGLTVLIISQVRDKIGVTFGETKTRSGGRAMDFYASQIIWLAEIGKNKKTVQGVERPVGVNVRAKCKKNKVGLPFRECDYVLEFGYGIDDIQTNAKFLLTIKDTDFLEEKFNITKTTLGRRMTAIKKGSDEEFEATRIILLERVKKRWKDIERGFMPTRRKYK